jgi:hypothetical protein
LLFTSNRPHPSNYRHKGFNCGVSYSAVFEVTCTMFPIVNFDCQIGWVLIRRIKRKLT